LPFQLKFRWNDLRHNATIGINCLNHRQSLRRNPKPGRLCHSRRSFIALELLKPCCRLSAHPRDFIVGHRALTWARKRKIAVVASVHTRFDTYLQYYGLQFLERMKAEPAYRPIPVIVITTEGRDEDFGRCLAAGASRCLRKPFRKLDLYGLVEELTGARPA
jgi:CheY-like chemotaxis protein